MYAHIHTHCCIFLSVHYLKILFMLVILRTSIGFRYGSCELLLTQVSSDYLLGDLSACNLYVIFLNKDYYYYYYHPMQPAFIDK